MSFNCVPMYPKVSRKCASGVSNVSLRCLKVVPKVYHRWLKCVSVSSKCLSKVPKRYATGFPKAFKYSSGDAKCWKKIVIWHQMVPNY